jgi:hypothetical protein
MSALRLLAIALALLFSASAAVAQVAEGWDEEAGRGGPAQVVAPPLPPIPGPPGQQPPILPPPGERPPGQQPPILPPPRERPPAQPPGQVQPPGRGQSPVQGNPDRPQPPGQTLTIREVIETIIRAQVFFPARTFQAAVENTASAIVGREVQQMRQDLAVVTGAFVNGSAFNMGVLRGEALSLGRRMQDATAPILAIGLAIAVLSALAGNAVGAGPGLPSLGQAFVRWLFIALVATNAIALLSLAHGAFNHLASYVIAGVRADPLRFANMVLPQIAGPTIGTLVFMFVFAMVVIIIVGLGYLARWVMLMLLTVIAPLCVASASLPYGSMIFGQWLMLYLKAELLHIANVLILGLGITAASSEPFIGIAVALGLVGILVTLNMSMFKDVFGGTISVVSGMLTVGAMALPLLGKFGAALAVGAGAANRALGSNQTSAGGSSSASASGPDGPDSNSNSASARSIAWRALTKTLSDSNTYQQMNQARRGNPLLNMLGGLTSAGEMVSQAQADAAQAQAKAAAEAERAYTNAARDIARDIGLESPEGIAKIASAIKDGATVGGKTLDGAQVAQGLRRSAPMLKALAKAYGGNERAAAALGYKDFADLAISTAAPDPGAKQSQKPADVLGAHVSEWLKQPPPVTSTSWDKMTPFDFAAGAFVARVTGANAEREPLWASSMQSLRTIFGDSYVQELIDRVARENWKERQLMDEIDRVRRDPGSTGRTSFEAPQVFRFWTLDSKTHDSKRHDGKRYDGKKAT